MGYLCKGNQTTLLGGYHTPPKTKVLPMVKTPQTPKPPQGTQTVKGTQTPGNPPVVGPHTPLPPTYLQNTVLVTRNPPEPPKPPIKINKHRPYYGGFVIGKVGVNTLTKQGVTPGMVNQVCTLTNAGKPNPTESGAWLKICYNVIQGYLAATQQGGTPQGGNTPPK